MTSLELDGFSATAVLDKELDELSSFLNDSFFSNCDLNQFKALGTFLQETPILEKLILKNLWYSEGAKRAQQMVGKPSVKTE